MKRKIKLAEIDDMLGLPHSKVIRLPSVGVMSERITESWTRQGYNIDAIDMALRYTHKRTNADLAALPPKVRQQYYRRTFRYELRTAAIWLNSLKEINNGSLYA